MAAAVAGLFTAAASAQENEDIFQPLIPILQPIKKTAEGTSYALHLYNEVKDELLSQVAESRSCQAEDRFGRFNNLVLGEGKWVHHDRSTGHVEKLVRWNECSRQNVVTAEVISAFPGACGARLVSKDLARALDQNLRHCAHKAARAMGMAVMDATKVLISHKGIEGDERHQNGVDSRYSLHNVYRAIDISRIAVGSVRMDHKKACEYIKFRKKGYAPAELKELERHALFFVAFRQCWDDAIQEEYAGCRSITEELGSVGCDDSDHQHHLHLSVPVPGSKYYQCR